MEDSTVELRGLQTQVAGEGIEPSIGTRSKDERGYQHPQPGNLNSSDAEWRIEIAFVAANKAVTEAFARPPIMLA